MNTSFEYIRDYLNNTVNDLFLDASVRRDKLLPSHDADITMAILLLANRIADSISYQKEVR